MRLFQTKLAVQLFNDPVTLADRGFKSLTMIQNLNGAAAALDGVVFLQCPKRRVTLGRLVPSMMARKSCVIGSDAVWTRCWAISSQRARRGLISCNRLQAAVCATCIPRKTA